MTTADLIATLRQGKPMTAQLMRTVICRVEYLESLESVIKEIREATALYSCTTEDLPGTIENVISGLASQNVEKEKA